MFLAMIGLFASAALALGAAAPAPDVPRDDCAWRVPVDAPIVDEFRPPAHPYGGGGNLGIEFGTGGGEIVVAVDDGRVSFLGPVGGVRWLVITHDSGLRSTYGPLEHTTAVRGQLVVEGDVVAVARAGLHLTARRGGRYLDPSPLLDGRCGRARLVAGRSRLTTRPSSGAFGGGGPVH
jgi:murein DD-endopeptidase MepM/ murein hydrolase activator NlpD